MLTKIIRSCDRSPTVYPKCYYTGTQTADEPHCYIYTKSAFGLRWQALDDDYAPLTRKTVSYICTINDIYLVLEKTKGEKY